MEGEGKVHVGYSYSAQILMTIQFLLEMPTAFERRGVDRHGKLVMISSQILLDSIIQNVRRAVGRISQHLRWKRFFFALILRLELSLTF